MMKRMTVTPKMAAAWLAAAARNRPISEMNVNKLARDMATPGAWEVNGETIKFVGAIGVGMCDGQTRCTACVKAGVSFETYVVANIEGYREIDQHRPRSLPEGVGIFIAEKLGLDGHCCLAISSALGMLGSYARQSRQVKAETARAAFMTHRECMDFIERNAELRRAVPEFSEYLRGRNLLRPSTAVALLWMGSIAGTDFQVVHAFLRGVRDGDHLERGAAALAYRNFIANSAQRKRIVSAREAFRGAVKAISHHINGTRMLVTKFTDYPEFPGAPPERVRAVMGI